MMSRKPLELYWWFWDTVWDLVKFTIIFIPFICRFFYPVRIFQKVDNV